MSHARHLPLGKKWVERSLGIAAAEEERPRSAETPARALKLGAPLIHKLAEYAEDLGVLVHVQAVLGGAAFAGLKRGSWPP